MGTLVSDLVKVTKVLGFFIVLGGLVRVNRVSAKDMTRGTISGRLVNGLTTVTRAWMRL